jgi:hypothetical protein
MANPTAPSAMAHYRAYPLDENNKILAGHDLDCDSDAEAIGKARCFADGCDVELWQGTRKIGTIAARRFSVAQLIAARLIPKRNFTKHE